MGVDVGDSSAREASAQRKKVLLKVIILGDSGHRVVSHASSGFVHTIIMVIIIIIIYVYALYIYIYIYIHIHIHIHTLVIISRRRKVDPSKLYVWINITTKANIQQITHKLKLYVWICET